MVHIMLLMQQHETNDTVTYTNYPSLKECLEALPGMLRQHLKVHNGNSTVPTYKLEQLFEFLDQIHYLSCLMEIAPAEYEMLGKESIKCHLDLWLKPRALKSDGRLAFAPGSDLGSGGQADAESVQSAQPSKLQLMGFDYGCLVTNSAATEPSSNSDAVGKSHDESFLHQNHVDAIDSITYVRFKLLEILTDIRMFNGTSDEAQFFYLGGMLMSSLFLLDSIDSNGKEIVRRRRKEAVEKIHKCFAILEDKATANKQIRDALVILTKQEVSTTKN